MVILKKNVSSYLFFFWHLTFRKLIFLQKNKVWHVPIPCPSFYKMRLRIRIISIRILEDNSDSFGFGLATLISQSLYMIQTTKIQKRHVTVQDKDTTAIKIVNISTSTIYSFFFTFNHYRYSHSTGTGTYCHTQFEWYGMACTSLYRYQANEHWWKIKNLTSHVACRAKQSQHLPPPETRPVSLSHSGAPRL